ncbi:hypothetical protein N0V90_005327 [Kalmusia sp. IMI 367209]|nr:hypothetical protein N0V90_005327 [Kalmusia sp. IMI 367209]
MQNGFCHPNGRFGKLGLSVANHLDIVSAINKLSTASHATKMQKLKGFVRGTWDADVLDDLAPDTSKGDNMINKTRNSAFLSTGLKELLFSRGINQLLCTSVGSNVCVESTVRDGVSHDFYCKTLSDATATLTMEDYNACMKNLVWFSGVTTVEEVLRALKKRQNKASEQD